jgi:hypothetical protein
MLPPPAAVLAETLRRRRRHEHNRAVIGRARSSSPHRLKALELLASRPLPLLAPVARLDPLECHRPVRPPAHTRRSDGRYGNRSRRAPIQSDCCLVGRLLGGKGVTGARDQKKSLSKNQPGCLRARQLRTSSSEPRRCRSKVRRNGRFERGSLPSLDRSASRRRRLDGY